MTDARLATGRQLIVARVARYCVCVDCPATPVDFENSPTVVGYCAAHGNVIADFLALVNAPGIVGFDAARERWRRGFNLLRS